MQNAPLIFDSFDLSFLVMQKLMVAKRETIFWGPEAKLMATALNKSWYASWEPVRKQFIAAFDMSGDVSVDGKKARKAMGKFSATGKKAWKGASKKVVQSIAAVSERADGHF